jgi:hypothetical protein
MILKIKIQGSGTPEEISSALRSLATHILQTRKESPESFHRAEWEDSVLMTGIQVVPKLFVRLGISMDIDPGKYEPTEESLAKYVSEMIKDGKYELDGDTYIPMDALEQVFGDVVDIGDIDLTELIK